GQGLPHVTVSVPRSREPTAPQRGARPEGEGSAMAKEDKVDAGPARREPPTSVLASGHSPGLQDGPTVSRIVLGTQLRRLREEAGISREAAGNAIRASHAKISRLELGRVGFKERDVLDLLALYGVTD